MDKKTFSEILEKLEGLDYFFISGFAVEVYTNGKRKARDLDVVIRKQDADVFAERLGCKAVPRRIEKQDFVIMDYGFETDFKGQVIEAITKYATYGMEKDPDRLFKLRAKKNYLGLEFFVEPIEMLVVHKAMLHRPKDIEDLKLLAGQKLNVELLREMANKRCDWKTLMKTLKELNYKV